MLPRCHLQIHHYRAQVHRSRVRALNTTTTQPLRPGFTVLAIESSCDDSSVAVLSLHHGSGSDARSKTDAVSLTSKVLFHKTITARSQQYNGIHPIVALESHNASVAALVKEACHEMRANDPSWKPSIVSATRGPGMRSNLAVGLNIAKGLSVAWNVPLLGVHHMQAHALTPRLCWTLAQDDQAAARTWSYDTLEPAFPYLSILASGGHTMLLKSESLIKHKTLAETQDIAIGDCLDKAARAILPAELLIPPYGRALERFAFPNGAADYNYNPPRNREEELKPRTSKWGWTFRLPLADKTGEKTSKRMVFSFSGLLGAVERILRPAATTQLSEDESTITTKHISEDERCDLAREVLRVSFEHLVSRMLLYLAANNKAQEIQTIVISGGVASNQYLRHVLRAMLDARGFSKINAIFPPVELCTDNALMIAWAGLEIYATGYTTSLDVEPIRKWPMDSSTTEGGILGVPGWNVR